MSSSSTIKRSHKNVLQEYCHTYDLGLPKYHTTHESGPAHKPCFRATCTCTLHDGTLLVLAGDPASSKKCAEQNAAECCLRWIANHIEDYSEPIVQIKTLDDLVPHIEQHSLVIFWDVENYKLGPALRELEPCLLIAMDSLGSNASDQWFHKSVELMNPQSTLVRMRAPTSLHDGADIGIIWMIASLGATLCAVPKAHCIIMSKDKIFCTVNDMATTWPTGFLSLKIIS